MQWRRKNDAFVVVVNDLHFFAQTITFDISFGDSEIGKVGFCSYHRPAETFGRHWAEVDAATCPDVDTFK